MSSLPRCAALLFLAILAVAPPVKAHGGFWRAYDILFEPGNPDHIVLRSDVWALIETRDGGRTWTWLCAELYRGRSGNAGEKRSMVVLPGGSMLVANRFEGLRRRGTDVCEEWVRADISEEWNMYDVVAPGGDGSHVVALGSKADGAGSIITQLFESTDLGQTFSELGTTLPADFSGSTLGVAPSAPNRLYAGGKIVSEPGVGKLARSDDGGATWEVVEVPISESNWIARVVAIDANSPNTVYVWKDRGETGGGDVQPDSLWLTQDAGDTWEMVFDAVGNLPGFTFSPTGDRLLVAGPEDGIWGADIEALYNEGAIAFEQILDERVWGLEWREEGLYAGRNDFTPAGIEPFSLGISQNGGKTFDPFFVICTTEPVSCPAGSYGDSVCPGKFSDPSGEGNFKEDFLDSQRCTERFGVSDAGAADAGGPTDSSQEPVTDVRKAGTSAKGNGSGCGCRAAGSRASDGRWAFALLAGAVAGVLRRRPRRKRVT